jgi:2,5-diketo-D-gluconate reductase A
MIGLGTWQLADGSHCLNAVRRSLDVGYRHIDTAQSAEYGNEASVGRAVRESEFSREELFITTKFFPGSDDPVAEAEASLERMGLDYIDLYLVHWPGWGEPTLSTPDGGATWAWPGMERVRELGYARSIGVSNFNISDLRALMHVATVTPSVNQIWINPIKYRRALITECARLGITVEGYSPLGTGEYLANPVVTDIAQRVGRTPAQVLLRWSVQRGIPTIPKSQHQQRMEENAGIFDFALSETDMSDLDGLDETAGTDLAFEEGW